MALIPHHARTSPFHDRMKVFVETEDVQVLDLAALGFSAEHTLEGDAHWSPSGHGEAAKYLLPFVEQLSLDRAASERPVELSHPSPGAQLERSWMLDVHSTRMASWSSTGWARRIQLSRNLATENRSRSQTRRHTSGG